MRSDQKCDYCGCKGKIKRSKVIGGEILQACTSIHCLNDLDRSEQLFNSVFDLDTSDQCV